MNKYLFSEPRKYDALRNGMFRCYFNEEITEQTITHEGEGGEAISETITNYGYNAVDVHSIDKGEIVDAIIRTRFSQSAVEAIMRHKIAKAEGSTAEFNEFNDFAEWAKTEANRILAE